MTAIQSNVQALVPKVGLSGASGDTAASSSSAASELTGADSISSFFNSLLEASPADYSSAIGGLGSDQSFVSGHVSSGGSR